MRKETAGGWTLSKANPGDLGHIKGLDVAGLNF